jgi:predicted 3-demethylubiquinone-9 3-methyltransferase (glyoxalase superfamily)
VLLLLFGPAEPKFAAFSWLAGADPKAEQCGWLKDKYGLSWQIAPAAMQELLGGGDKARMDRVTQAVLKMKKFDIAALERAAAG